jgi:hypothetical protein
MIAIRRKNDAIKFSTSLTISIVTSKVFFDLEVFYYCLARDIMVFHIRKLESTIC